MNIDRRVFLRNSAMVGALALPSSAHAHQEPGKYRQLHIEDDHAHWLVKPGDVVLYDENDRMLRDRVTYVTLTNELKSHYVCRARLFEGVWWAERLSQHNWYGPMDGALFQRHILGRAVAVMKRIL